MDQRNDDSYYVTRAKKSFEMAQRATNPAIAAIHAEMATRYQSILTQGQRLAGTANTAQAA